MSTIEMSYMEVGDDVVEIVDAKSRNDIKQLNVNKDDLYRVKADSIKRTFEGDTILLDDCSNNGFDGLRVLGRSEQDSTTGTQLLPYPYLITGNTANGGTFNVQEDGGIACSGTPTSYIGNTIYKTRLMFADKFTVCFLGNAQNVLIDANIYDENDTNIVLSQKSLRLNESTFIDVSDYSKNCWLYLTVKRHKDNVAMSGVAYPMIVAGNVAPTEYEPYTGGKPSPSVDYPQPINSVGDSGKVDVGVYGKNLFDMSQLLKASGWMESNGVYFGDIRDLYLAFGESGKTFDTPPFLENKRYTVSFLGYSTDVNAKAMIGFMYADGTNSKVRIDSTNEKVFTLTSEEGKVISGLYATYHVSGYTTYLRNIQLELGTEATPYEPYCPKQSLSISTPNGLPGIQVTDPSLATYTDQNGIMWCADEVDFARGKYVKRVNKLVLDGVTEGHKMTGTDGNNSDKYGHNFAYILIKDKLLGGVFMANVGKSTSYYSVEGIVLSGVNTSMSLTLSDEKTGLTADDSKTVIVNKINAWLTENHVTVYYQLANPIETDLTQAELDSYKALHSNYLNTTILNDSNARMEVTYSADTATYLDNTYGKEIKRLDDTNTIKRTYLGDAIAATDSAEAKFEGLRVFGRSEQESTSGYQLFDINANKSISNKTYMYEFTLKPNTPYTLSTNAPVTKVASLYLNGGSSASNNVNINIPRTITTDDTGYLFIYVRWGINEGEDSVNLYDAVLNGTYWIMLNEGSTPLPYEPYTGGKPSPSVEYQQPFDTVGKDGSIDVGVYGKNLFDANSLEVSTNTSLEISDDGYSITAVGGTKSSYSNSYYYLPETLVNGLKGKAVYFKCDSITSSHESYGIFRITITTTDGTEIKNSIYARSSTVNMTFDIPSNAKTIVVIIYTSHGEKLSADNTIVMNGGRFGIVDSEYEPYKAKQSLITSIPNGLPGIKTTNSSIITYVDEDGNSWCSDEVDYIGNKRMHRVNKEFLTGVPNFIETTDYLGRFVWANCLKNNYKNGSVIAKATFANWVQWAQSSLNKDYFAIDGKSLYYKPSESMTVDDVNGLFAEMIASASPPEILGILATPIETDLSAEEIEAYRALHSNYPTTTILNDESAYTEVTLVADTKNHIEQNYVPVDSYKALEARVLAIEKALA